MKQIKKSTNEAVRRSFEEKIKQDKESLNSKKEKLLKELKLILTEKDFALVTQLVDCCDNQNFLTAMDIVFCEHLHK